MSELTIEMGIGWKPHPTESGRLVSANDSDYVAEILALRAENERLRAEIERWRRLYIQSQEVALRLTNIAEKLAQG